METSISIKNEKALRTLRIGKEATRNDWTSPGKNASDNLPEALDTGEAKDILLKEKEKVEEREGLLHPGS